MATITFTVSAALAAELQGLAASRGFSSAKEMTVQYFKAELLEYRKKVKREELVSIKIDDVIIS